MTIQKGSAQQRIIIIGTDGTGRTGLCEALAKKLEITCILDRTRERVHALGYQTIYELPDRSATQVQLFDDLVVRQTQASKFVSDTSVIDWYANWQRWEWNNASPAFSEALYERMRACAESYSHVLFLQPSFQPPYDGYRWLEPNHRAQTTRVIRSLIIECQLADKTLELAESSPDETAQRALKFILSPDQLDAAI